MRMVKTLFNRLSRLGKNSALGYARRVRNFVTGALPEVSTYLDLTACVSSNGL